MEADTRESLKKDNLGDKVSRRRGDLTLSDSA